MRLGDQKRRLRIGFAVCCCLLLVIGGRLVQLQGVDSASYAQAAVNDRIREFSSPARRGQILDRDGRVLAYSTEASLIYADPTVVTAPDVAAAKLAPLLGESINSLREKLTRPGTEYVELARQMTPEDAKAIMDLDLAGIGEQPEQQRIYPGDAIAASLLGITNREGTGVSGLEAQFDDALSGTPGSLVAEVGKGGEVIPNGVHTQTDAVPGAAVRLTLSEDVQYVAQTALDQMVEASGAKGGRIAVLQADTADILALAASSGTDPPDQAGLTDPSVTTVFEPGSANKVVTFAGALDQGLITPETELTVPGSIRFADTFIHDAWSHGDLDLTATGVLAKSSNVGTLMIARELGEQPFYDYARAFGEGSRTGVELPDESAGSLPPPDEWSGTTFGNLPIGQGVSMTILQLASVYQTIANDGVRVPPRIVDSVISPTGDETHPEAPPATRVVSADAARTVRSMMESVITEDGTAPGAAIDGYRVAGKTGTAQQPDPDCHCYTSAFWSTFAGMAPAENPRVVIALMLDNPEVGVPGGAGPSLFKNVMTDTLRRAGIPPSGSQAPTIALTGSG